ncbi:unnamed protein product [Ectocarpus sp. CCAP 1310/34]|nr:unnamed protein product [Ectocarpus sp. CCAP 1310/34]
MHYPPLPPQQGASVIQSVELKDLNENGRRTVVQNLVSICRRCSEKVHLGLHCALARDGERCFLHGTENERKAKVAKGGTVKEEALRLNYYSSGAIRFPLAAQTADAWLWAETFIEFFCHLPFHLQGNRDFVSEECLGSDKYVMPRDDPDGEMLLNTPSEGVDFFEEATGAGGGGAGDNEREIGGEQGEERAGRDEAGEGSSEESDDDDALHAGLVESGGAGVKGDVTLDESPQGGGVAGVSSKGAPKVTLGDCVKSAQTVPSLLKTLEVCKVLYVRKKETFHHAFQQTRQARNDAFDRGPAESWASAEAGALAGAGASAAAGASPAAGDSPEAGVSVAFGRLLEAIRLVETVCLEGRQVVDDTLEAVDDGVLELTKIKSKVQRQKQSIPTPSLRLPEELGYIFISEPGCKREEMVHAPAALVLTTRIKALMVRYVEAVVQVAKEEAAVFVMTGVRIMVVSSHLGQDNTGTLRHMAWRESGPWTFFSPCANEAGVNMSTKRKCPACAEQVLVNTACLRAFSFCLVIGTNALESFNGSVAAMVSKRSDFYISHVGRAQLALLKRCFPGGYREVVRRIRKACGLPPLTNRAEEETLVHQRKARHLEAGHEVWSSAAVRVGSDSKLKRKHRRSLVQTKHGAELKAANEKSQAELYKSVGEDKRARAKGGDAGANGLLSYDRGGSNASRNLNEGMVAPAKRKRTSGACKECGKFGVPAFWLAQRQHSRAAKTRCAKEQRLRVAAGRPETLLSTPPSRTGSPAVTGVVPPTPGSAGDAAGKATAPPTKAAAPGPSSTTRGRRRQRQSAPPKKTAAPGPSSATRGRRQQRQSRRPAKFADAYVGSSDDSEVPESRESAHSTSSSDDGSEP